MKKMTRYDLDTMARELHLIDEQEQRQYLGGTNCSHGVNTNDMCPKCNGIDPISFETYSFLDSKKMWPGGWVEFGPGEYSYVLPNMGDSTEVVVTGQVDSYCKGAECTLDHEHFCSDHGEYYYGTSGCTTCNEPTGVVTGICDLHHLTYTEGQGECPECVRENQNDQSSSGNSGGETNTCPVHGTYVGQVCPACLGSNTGGSGGKNDKVLPGLDVDYVVDHLADGTFNEEARIVLKEAINTFLDNDLGQSIYNQLCQSEEFVTFRIGETEKYLDKETNEWVNASAQYRDGVVTFYTDGDITAQNLLEELTHAAQHDIYGNRMTDKDLNYEYEAKVIDCMYSEGAGPNWGFKDEDDVEFRIFCTGIVESGYTDENKVIEKYQYYFNKWNDGRYTGDKGQEFNPVLFKELISKYQK